MSLPMDENYNYVANTYRGVRVEDIMTMFEICVKQGVDFNNPKTHEYITGFQAGVEYMNKEIKKGLLTTL